MVLFDNNPGTTPCPECGRPMGMVTWVGPKPTCNRPGCNTPDNDIFDIDTDDTDFDLDDLLDDLDYDRDYEPFRPSNPFDDDDSTCMHDALERSRPPSMRGAPHMLVCNCPKCQVIC